MDRDPYMFTRERAPIDLGVGKNMVRAIRYWGVACKVIEETPREGDSRAASSCSSVRVVLSRVADSVKYSVTRSGVPRPSASRHARA